MNPNLQQNNATNSVGMAFGTIVFAITITGWLIASVNHIDVGPLWIVSVPVISALFIGTSLQRVSTAAQQTANQTDGSLDQRIRASVTDALAQRDATRTAVYTAAAQTPSMPPASNPILTSPTNLPGDGTGSIGNPPPVA